METHLTNLQKFLSQLTPYNNVDKQRQTAIDALIEYIEALYGQLSAEEGVKLEKLLYQLLRSIENNMGFNIYSRSPHEYN